MDFVTVVRSVTGFCGFCHRAAQCHRGGVDFVTELLSVTGSVDFVTELRSVTGSVDFVTELTSVTGVVWILSQWCPVSQGSVDFVTELPSVTWGGVDFVTVLFIYFSLFHISNIFILKWLLNVFVS